MRTISDREVLESMNHVEMIRRKHLWPKLVLPLKKPELWKKNMMDDNALGVLVQDGEKYKVYVVNLYEFLPTEKPDFVYDSPEAVVADGWIVD